MSELTALSEKLAALTAEDVPFTKTGARIVSQAGDPPAMVALLRAIDETVLERTLVAQIGDLRFDLAVSGCRLRGVVDASDKVKDVEAVKGKVLSRDETEVLDKVGDLLKAACAADPKVTVQAKPIVRIGSSAEAGISSKGLAELWSIDMNAESAPPMQRFIATQSVNMLSHIHVSSRKVVGSSGDAKALKDAWKKQIAGFRKRYKELNPSDSETMLVALDQAVGGKQGMALAVYEDDACLFTYDPENLPGFLNTWAGIVG